MKYAVIHASGKQHKVSEGDIITLDHIAQQPQSTVTFSEVLLYVSDETCQIGKPFIKDMKVFGTLLEEKKGKKIRVAKFKAKARFRRVTGHRSLYSLVKITGIGENKPQQAKEETKPQEPKKEPVKKTAVKKEKKKEETK